MIFGALLGVSIVILAWLVATREPVVATVVACGIVGAGAGLAAALAARRIGQRRRPVRKKAAAARQAA